MANTCPKCQHENPEDTLFCGKCGTQFPDQEKIVVTETMETPKEELTTGSTFAGKYQIIEELGKGGMETSTPNPSTCSARFTNNEATLPKPSSITKNSSTYGRTLTLV
jgi:predicted amidophosphoribosyltransferase